ncbi:hypothetical protein [Bizionia arctica]|uniref:Uncharacterized protein n=1 Tax=Bizionia arctica TaxID=1495645 RepID=A0A917GJF3_9FLAO|nr:hypothetical protein [Bizionia arctica]GGG48143.1 hypothetical protein GCM10010976_19410 [Bizionia arctica]
MKKLIYMIAFLAPAVFFAQEKPVNVNVSEETTTKIITVNDGREVTEQKVKVTTREVQDIELDSSDKNKVNQQIVASPTKVTQTVEIEDDRDTYYDSISESVTYNYNNTNYILKKNSNGFLITGSDAQPNFGNCIITNRANNYIFTSDNYNGIGYFDANSNFVVEYYDTSKKATSKKIFTLAK